MMAKGQFVPFKCLIGLSLFFLMTSCARATPLPPDRSTAQVQLPQLNVKAELSSNSVVAGTIVLVTLRPPVDQKVTSFIGEFEGIELPFFTSTALGNGVYEAVLGVPYDRKPGPGKVKVKVFQQGTESSQFEIPLEVVAGDYASEVLHVDKRRVNPTRKKDIQRILKEQAEVAAIYKRVTPQKYWPGPFQLPIESKITSPFGTRRIYNGQLKNFHPGLDLKAPLKTPVLAAAPGVVVLAKSLFYTGNTVMIDHGYGIITLYAHMTSLTVKEGQIVKARELVGLSGKTGRVNGPHLHWQAVVHRVKVNPLGLTQVIR